MGIIDTLDQAGVIAIVRSPDADEAVAVCQALVDGGIRAIELALTIDHCFDAIARVNERFGDEVAVGAGTVLTSEHLARAADAGAAFVASPHGEPALIAEAERREIPILAGAMTPTEILAAWRTGATGIKLFPASVVGPGLVRALQQPLPDIPIVPTGGVTVSTMRAWFEAGVRAVGMGGNLATGSTEQVAAKARAVRAELRRIRGSGEAPR